MRSSKQRGPKDVVMVALLVLTLVYPFLVYSHVDAISPRWYGAALLAVVILRFAVMGNHRRLLDWVSASLIAGFCLLIMIFESKALLKFYPVMMSAGMGGLFIVSLSAPQCLIERFARAGGKTPPAAARGYLRQLNLYWGVLLLSNGLISAYTAAFASLATWTLYNGLISYLVIASFVVIELGYRRYYKKRHNIVDE